MLLLSLVAVVLGKIIITGVICFVIYQIVKYRMDRMMIYSCNNRL